MDRGALATGMHGRATMPARPAPGVSMARDLLQPWRIYG